VQKRPTPLLVDLSTTAALVALSESSVQRLVRDGSFPKPRELSPRRVAWLYREVEEWAEQRPVSTLLPPENTGRKEKQ